MDTSIYLPSTMKSRSDYGLKIAKKGYDVLYASDNQLLYNSSFPLLQVVEYITDDTQWEVTDAGAYQVWSEFNGTLTTQYRHNMRRIHGLGHPPMIVPFGASYFSTSSKLEWNAKYIYSSNTFNTLADYNTFINGGAKVGKYAVFAVDIETDVEYPYVDDGIDTEWGQTYDYGIKHILTDNSNATDPNDLGLNANIQSIMVVAVKVALASQASLSRYQPNGITADKLAPFCFIKSSITGRWRVGGVSAQAVTGFRPAIPSMGLDYYTLDGQLIGEKCSLVLVRLPMISPDKQTMSFNM